MFKRDEPAGERLGLPADGPGSLASSAARIGGFVVDCVVANLLAGLPYLFGVRYGPGNRGFAVYLAFLLQEFVLVSVAGATIGKQLLRIRVVRSDGGRLPWPWVLVRTLLLGLLVPAVIWDRDGRGLHDRAADALTVRVGRPAPAAPAPSASARPVSSDSARPAGGSRRAGADRPAGVKRADPTKRRRKRR